MEEKLQIVGSALLFRHSSIR